MLGFNDKAAAPPNPAIVTRIARKIVDRGMTVPAVLALEMMKPLSFIGSQAMVFFGPILTAFVRAETYYEMTELLEDYHNVEFLVNELERLEQVKKRPEPDESKTLIDTKQTTGNQSR